MGPSEERGCVMPFENIVTPAVHFDEQGRFTRYNTTTPAQAINATRTAEQAAIIQERQERDARLAQEREARLAAEGKAELDRYQAEARAAFLSCGGTPS